MSFPDPPPLELADAFAIKLFPQLSKILNPYRIGIIQKLSIERPNQPFVKSVIKELRYLFLLCTASIITLDSCIERDIGLRIHVNWSPSNPCKPIFWVDWSLGPMYMGSNFLRAAIRDHLIFRHPRQSCWRGFHPLHMIKSITLGTIFMAIKDLILLKEQCTWRVGNVCYSGVFLHSIILHRGSSFVLWYEEVSVSSNMSFDSPWLKCLICRGKVQISM